MPKDIYLQSAGNFAEMGRSNERFIANVNRQLMEDLRSRTENWGKSVFRGVSDGEVSGLSVLGDQISFEIPHKEFIDASERQGNFPWWQVQYVIGPFTTVQIAFNKNVDRVGIYSMFRPAYITMTFEEGDVRFQASSFRQKGNREDVAVLRDLDAVDPGKDEPYDLFVSKTPFERVGLALEVMDWVNDVIDLRKYPHQGKQKAS